MLHNNNTPFAGIGFEQWHRDGATMAVIAVRGDYEFVAGGRLKLCDAQEIVLADEFEGDPQKTPLVRPGDLVPFKPGTDITFLGNAFAPDRAPMAAWDVSIRAHDLQQSLRVCGPRNWVPDGDGWLLSDAQFISSLPVCYAKASGGRMIGDPGGTVDPRNPIGINLIHREFTPRSRTYPAAQIDSLEHPVTHWDQRPPLPQGFGPMAPWWQARQRFAGTYDKHWEDNVHPRLPADFDYRFYNVAHPELVLNGYLTCGDIIELTNLTPNGHAAFALPDVQPFARFSFTDGREVTSALNLDGVHLDFRNGAYQMTLTWRAWIEICPAFYRIDLECMPFNDVTAMDIPVPGERGLQTA